MVPSQLEESLSASRMLHLECPGKGPVASALRAALLVFQVSSRLVSSVDLFECGIIVRAGPSCLRLLVRSLALLGLCVCDIDCVVQLVRVRAKSQHEQRRHSMSLDDARLMTECYGLRGV